VREFLMSRRCAIIAATWAAVEVFFLIVAVESYRNDILTAVCVSAAPLTLYFIWRVASECAT